jgi:sporulation protein YlmC with PRC-barrel domain
MKRFVTAVAVVAGLALAAGAGAQSSSGSSQPSSATDQPAASQPPSSQSAPTTQQSPSSQSAPSGVLVDASSIIGTTVRAQGKDIGKVERLMVDPKDGRVRTVVIQQGGTLGVGGKSVSVPWESVKVGQDDGRIVVTAEQQMLEQAPAASPRTDSKSDSSSKTDSSKSDSKK